MKSLKIGDRVRFYSKGHEYDQRDGTVVSIEEDTYTVKLPDFDIEWFHVECWRNQLVRLRKKEKKVPRNVKSYIRGDQIVYSEFEGVPNFFEFKNSNGATISINNIYVGDCTTIILKEIL